MTITNTQSKVVYSTNTGTTTYTFSFPVQHESDLSVYLNNTALVKDVDYTINPNSIGNINGGSISYTPVNDGDTLTLRRILPITQETDYNPYDPFPAETHEADLDKGAMIDQQLQEQFDRTLHVGLDWPADVSLVFPDYDAGKGIMWSEQDPKVLVNSDDGLNGIVSSATAQADRAKAEADRSQTEADRSDNRATDSENARDESEAARDLSRQYAINPVDTAVPDPANPGAFSSLHYSTKASESSDLAERWAQLPKNQDVLVGPPPSGRSSLHFSEISKDWSSMPHPLDPNGGHPDPTDPGTYSAKVWADRDYNQPVDNSAANPDFWLYSARHWAEKAKRYAERALRTVVSHEITADGENDFTLGKTPPLEITYESVYYNGAILTPGTDYTLTPTNDPNPDLNRTQVHIEFATKEKDVVQIISFASISVMTQGTYVQRSRDKMEGRLRAYDADPANFPGIPAMPVDPDEFTSKQYVDLHVLLDGTRQMTGQLKLLAGTDPVADDDAARKLYVDTLVNNLRIEIADPDTGYLPITGGVMKGQITSFDVPTIPLHLANKQYVDAIDTRLTAEDLTFLKLDGTRAMTGDLTLPANAAPTDDMAITKKFYDDQQAALPDYLELTGGTMTGAITLPPVDPVADDEAVRKLYVDAVRNDLTNSIANYVPLTGETMLGPLLLAGNPINVLEAATKQYVDDSITAVGGLPVGMIVAYGSIQMPPGWLLCDGTAIPPQHTTLIAMIGPNTPDLRDQFIRGTDTSSAILTTYGDSTKRPNTPFSGNTSTTPHHYHAIGVFMQQPNDYIQQYYNYTSSNAPFPVNKWEDLGSNPAEGQPSERMIATSSDGDHSHTLSITGGGDVETAPQHMKLAYMIKT